MSHKVNLVRVLTAATGNSSPITLGDAYSQLFMTPAEAGAVDGRVYTYLLVDGNNWELGRGVYTASGTTLARTTIIASRIAGTLGTSRISLTGTAQVRFVEAANDMDGVRGTRIVTGTSDVLANNDLGYVVEYNSVSAVAVSLGQAGQGASFMAGWAAYVQNLNTGVVTITPTISTINGAASLQLSQRMGAYIFSDGTNYSAYYIPISKPLLAENDLAEVDATNARDNLGIWPQGTTMSGGSISNIVDSGTYLVDNTVGDGPAGLTYYLLKVYTLGTRIFQEAWPTGTNDVYIRSSTDSGTTWTTWATLNSAYAGTMDAAASIDLENTIGDYVTLNASGATTISSISLDLGHERTVLVNGPITFQNGASIVLPGNADLSCAATDVCIFRGTSGGGARLVGFMKGDQGPRTPDAGQHINFASAANNTYSTGTTTFAFGDSIPTQTEGTEIMTCSITPKYANSKLVIRYNVRVAGDNGNTVGVALFQDSTSAALDAEQVTITQADAGLTLQGEYVMTAGTTSQTTFKLRIGVPAGHTWYVNGISSGRRFGGVLRSTIIIEEIKQ